jgi:ankyrin repeat protein
MTIARTGNAETAGVLLARGADPNVAERSRHETALMWAVAWQHADVAQVLLKHGADVRARSVNGFTPLLFAARDGDIESTRLLLGAGADLNEAAPDGTTPLLAAAHNARTDIVALLLERGANPNVSDSVGFTALHASVWRRVGQVSLVQLLLAHDADPNARLKRPPRGLPGEIGNLRSSGTLAGATPFVLAAKAADATVMRALAAAGADPKIPTEDGTTALMLAAGMGRSEGADQNTSGEFARALEAVTLAIELGVDVNAVNRGGQTALHGAASTSADSVIEYLASKGAKVDVQDTKGQTPLALTNGDADFALTVRSSTAALLRKLGAESLTRE